MMPHKASFMVVWMDHLSLILGCEMLLCCINVENDTILGSQL